MITVDFYYTTKAGETKEGTQRFYDLYKACKFLYMCRKKGMRVPHWSADDPEEAEYLWRRGL